MARINNKINLPTNTTDIKMLAKYLYAIGKKKIVTVAEEQELFSSVKSQFSRKKKIVMLEIRTQKLPCHFMA